MKIGDKVKIREDINAFSKADFGACPGKVGKVVSIDKSIWPIGVRIGGSWVTTYWAEDELELIDE